ATSKALKDLPFFQQIARLSTLVRLPGLHAALMTRELVEAMTSLAGGALHPSDTQLLLSLPHQGTWTLDGLNWHVDIAPTARNRQPGIQAFVLIDDVAPRGGATLALAGSHRAEARRGAQAAQLRELLRTPTSRQGQLRDLGLAVVEMSGRSGDVFLMDLRVLHTPSINATKDLRMMATARYFLSDAGYA
ncbi:MAG: phytanoyl-CoA dioxygenase family protein, partial [Rhizobacter sp.]